MSMKHFLIVALLVAAPVMSVRAVGTAATPTPTPNVNLVATLNNGPAFSAVKWSVYRLDNGRSVPIETFNHRHSLSIALPPGRYRADASLNNVSRSRIFDVSSRTGSNIVVAMD